MHKGLVTTIIPVYNRPQLLREAVASVLAQSYRPVEVIIVDDGSTDDTPRVAEELAAGHAEIRLIRQQNSGPGAAREAGRQLARGEFIQYLDSDDLLMPNKFTLQVAGLTSNQEFDVSYGITRFTDSNGKILAHEWKSTGKGISSLFPSMLMERWWGTSTPLYRSSLLNKAGPWLNLINEEDWEYDCRLAAQGAILHYVDSLVSEERDHQGVRLSREGSVNQDKLKDRATAHQLIFQHAQQAGITPEVPEMRHFARELFLLSRQCGAAGLADESKHLFELARTASLPEIGSGLQFRAYRVASLLLGWKTTGKLSVQLDKFRSIPA
jgi:hypothetical protein